MFETSLRSEGQRRLTELGNADLLVGIPSYKNAQTIGLVVDRATEGMQAYYSALRPVIAVVDGGSSDETMSLALSRSLPPPVRRIVTTYQGIQGKGSAVRAIFEMARVLGVKVCIVLEADLVSLSPEWVHKLATPILKREYDLAVPVYARPLVEGAATDILAYPLTRLLYNTDVRQPMAGDFAVSGALAAKLFERDVWETDVARHGIDIWMTTVAINENIKMCQVRLGTKIEDKREAAVSIDPGFIQSVGTLFRMMEIYRRRWPETHPLRTVPFFGNGALAENQRLTGLITVDMLSDAFLSGARRYRRFWRTIMAPSHFALIFELVNKPRGATHLAPDLWARLVFDFAVVYNKGENDPDKVVAALLPLYYARIATILRETNAKADAVEKSVQAQAQCFIDEKKYLLHRWQTSVPWQTEGVR
ncbi:MAG: glycosyltransferase [Chloroflexota bacterium]|nr:glycosyltransferase [Chloroflexota bacterium]